MISNFWEGREYEKKKNGNGKQEFKNRRNGMERKVKDEVLSHFSTYLGMVQVKTAENSKGTKTRNLTLANNSWLIDVRTSHRRWKFQHIKMEVSLWVWHGESDSRHRALGETLPSRQLPSLMLVRSWSGWGSVIGLGFLGRGLGRQISKIAINYHTDGWKEIDLGEFHNWDGITDKVLNMCIYINLLLKRY